MVSLSIALLGPPRIVLAGRPLERGAREGLALLAFLAVEHDRAHSRGRLADPLWPDADEDAARNNLRIALAGRRRRRDAAGDARLRAERRRVQFVSPGAGAFDLLTSRRLLAEGHGHAHADRHNCAACLTRPAPAVDLYQGECLADLTVPDSLPFGARTVIARALGRAYSPPRRGPAVPARSAMIASGAVDRAIDRREVG